MGSRFELHDELCQVLGTKNVYFQPPATVRMKYPAIRYTGAGIDTRRANDKVYMSTRRYEGVVIDSNPDSAIPYSLLSHFQMCELGSPYPSDNLNHFPFTIYY